ncbi:MAG: cell wall-binding repeat-containing protein, partial [Actinobacteria bacterium]
DVATTGELAYVTSSDTGWNGCAGTAASDGATPTAVAVGSGGLRLIDAASPSVPFLAGFNPVGGAFATMAGDLVLVTDPDEGARLYRYTQVTDRDAGLSRYETAVEMSKDIPASDYVVLATGATYPDALCGASLAYALDAPILLVRPDGIPDEVAARITELGATKAIVLGGTAAVGQGVIDDLAALGITGDNVTRLSGSDRYETAEQIALELESVLGAGSCDTAFVATGLNYPDALAAGGAAAKMGAPILLTKPWELPDATADALDALGCADTIVLGGTGAVPDAIAADLPSPERLAGATRYDTAARIADFSLTEPSCAFTPGELFVVTGLNFPDALPCGVISAMHDAPTLLVNTGVPGATGAFVADHAAEVDSIRIVGGTGAVPADVEYELFALVQGQ